MRFTNLRGRPMHYLAVPIFVLVVILFLKKDISAAMVSIPGLFNTGVDDNGQVLENEAPEEHYILTGVKDNAFVISNSAKPSPWVSAPGQSAWIGPENGNQNAPEGEYIYTLTFDLDGLIPATAQISGLWASDDGSEIFLNSVKTNLTIPLDESDRPYDNLYSFTLTSGFVDGQNILEFRVNNALSGDPNPSGLLVTDLNGTATAVPVPKSIWLLGSVLFVIAGLKRQRCLVFLVCLIVAPLSAFGGDFDGSKSLFGSVDKILEIYPSRINNDADPDTVGLPRNFFIDFKEKTVRPSKDSVIRRTSKIKRVEHVENKLILQGIEEGVENVDDGLAWSMTISKKTGKAVLSASGDGVAYVVFGTCASVENNVQ